MCAAHTDALLENRLSKGQNSECLPDEMPGQTLNDSRLALYQQAFASAGAVGVQANSLALMGPSMRSPADGQSKSITQL